jgi:hypothetical protein
MKELTEAEKQVTTETHELLVSLDEKQKELTEYQTNIVNMKKNASDLQTFIAVKQIEKEVVSTDMGGDSSATIIWACLSLLRTKTLSQGFASTTTSANF